jgi:multiple sugar transport system ATP-binding protein
MEVKLEHLTKIFPGRKTKEGISEDVHAVDDMSIVVPDGKLLGLLGPSGCGKSTTLYMIAGLHKPTGGKIWFGDLDVTNVPPENRGIGLVFQNYALYPHLSVRQNIQFPLYNVRPKLSKEEMETLAQEAANLVDIGNLLDRKPKELSGGQQQRVAIARALAKRPRVLLLDEPLSNLDARLRLQTREEIKRIQRSSGVTTVFVTHDQEEAMSISDVIVVMNHGVVQQIDEPQTVYDEPANLFVAKFLGNPAINIFEGELKAGKLYIDGKLFDSGYKSKGKFSLLDEGIFQIAAEFGFKPSFEEYMTMLNGEAVKPFVPTKGNPVPSNEPEKIPFVLTLENIYLYVSENGCHLKAEDFKQKVFSYRASLGVNRPVRIGIRPESFSLVKVESEGIIPLDIRYIEHIGRDISIIGNVHDQENSKVRVIIPSELRKDILGKDRIDMFAKRFYVFEESGERIK